MLSLLLFGFVVFAGSTRFARIRLRATNCKLCCRASHTRKMYKARENRQDSEQCNYIKAYKKLMYELALLMCSVSFSCLLLRSFNLALILSVWLTYFIVILIAIYTHRKQFVCVSLYNGLFCNVPNTLCLLLCIWIECFTVQRWLSSSCSFLFAISVGSSGIFVDSLHVNKYDSRN